MYFDTLVWPTAKCELTATPVSGPVCVPIPYLSCWSRKQSYAVALPERSADHYAGTSQLVDLGQR